MRSVLIGQIVKTYDYINRVVLTLPLTVYEGTWTYSPLSFLCITMILRVCRKFLKLLHSPTGGGAIHGPGVHNPYVLT